MRVTISSDLIERIAALAAAEPEREVCGLLLGSDRRIEDIVPAPNVAVGPSRRFEVDPRAQFDAIRAWRAGGPAVIGCYHSHPSGDASPSASDRASIGGIGEIWLIHAAGATRAWCAETADSFAEITLVAKHAACVPT